MIATFLHNPRAQKYQPSFQEYYNNLKQNYANMHITIYATCILNVFGSITQLLLMAIQQELLIRK